MRQIRTRFKNRVLEYGELRDPDIPVTWVALDQIARSPDIGPATRFSTATGPPVNGTFV